MAAPSSDRAGIRQTYRALKAAGYEPVRVYDGEESFRITSESDAIANLTAVDQSWLHVKLPAGHDTSTDHPEHSERGADKCTGWVFFVLGNAPDEIICDYTCTLEPVLGPLQEGWWK